MKHDQLVEYLEPIEKRYKQDYCDQERELIYKRFFWMTGEMFRELCGLVIAIDSFRIPAVDEFTKIQMAHPDKFKRIQKVHEQCETCNGSGVRMFLQRRHDRKHVAPAARCDCRNGDHLTRFPSVKDAEKLVGFARWLERHEPAFKAVSDADRMAGVGEPKRETESSPEVEIDESIPF